MERVMGFEPMTSYLESKYSTAELHPLNGTLYRQESYYIK
jgi:hypothetical protein